MSGAPLSRLSRGLRALRGVGALGLLALALAAPPARAANSLQRWTVDGGGQFSFGGNYTLVGTAGQPDAGVLAGGLYTLYGGFWFPGPYGQISGVPDDGAPPPPVLALRCAPNPFKATTTVRFELPQAGPVRLRVFDVSGRPVATLADALLPAGANALTWDGSAHGSTARSGVYFVALEAAGRVLTEKVLIVR